MTTETVAAKVTIHRAGDMTEEGRKAIADWLRQMAEQLEEEGHNYAPRFNGRYIGVDSDNDNEPDLFEGNANG